MRPFVLALVLASLGFAPLPFKKPGDRRTDAEKRKAGDLLIECRPFRGEPIKRVFIWFGNQTGIPVVYSGCPSITFTYLPSKRPTNSEFLAALNEQLVTSGWRLIEREKNYFLAPADSE